jgi:hypothetical protein
MFQLQIFSFELSQNRDEIKEIFAIGKPTYVAETVEKPKGS